MEIELSGLNFTATVWEVKRAIAGVLHGEYFFNQAAHKSRQA